MFEQWRHDFRLAWRGLRRAPLFTAAAALTLALGIAGTTVMFALVRGILLRPLPVPEQDRLVLAWAETDSSRSLHWPFRVADLQMLGDASRTFESVAGVGYNGAVPTVAVENDSIADFYLTSFPGGDLAANVHRYPSMGDAMTALSAGETMAAMGPRAQLEFGAGQGVAVHVPPLPGFARAKWTVGIAVHQSHRDLAYALDDAIAAALADGRMAKAFADHGLAFTPPER